MSENLNRSNQDFSKYDSMRIEELEEILRADAMGPERDDSDVDEILYAMEVLAKKRRQNGIAGKTAHEAYQDFQQHYIPLVEDESAPKRKATIITFRRIAAVAASLVLVFSLTTTANAFSFRDVWNAVVTWAQETFSFSMGSEDREPTVTDGLSYSDFHELLKQYKVDFNLVPQYIPEGYSLSDFFVDENPMQKTYIAIYENDGTTLKISIRSFSDAEPEQIEKSNNLTEVYSRSGINYYLFSNYENNRAAWIWNGYECYISGELSIDEMKTMIDSIGKG